MKVSTAKLVHLLFSSPVRHLRIQVIQWNNLGCLPKYAGKTGMI